MENKKLKMIIKIMLIIFIFSDFILNILNLKFIHTIKENIRYLEIDVDSLDYNFSDIEDKLSDIQKDFEYKLSDIQNDIDDLKY